MPRCPREKPGASGPSPVALVTSGHSQATSQGVLGDPAAGAVARRAFLSHSRRTPELSPVSPLRVKAPVRGDRASQEQVSSRGLSTAPWPGAGAGGGRGQFSSRRGPSRHRRGGREGGGPRPGSAAPPRPQRPRHAGHALQCSGTRLDHQLDPRPDAGAGQAGPAHKHAPRAAGPGRLFGSQSRRGGADRPLRSGRGCAVGRWDVRPSGKGHSEGPRGADVGGSVGAGASPPAEPPPALVIPEKNRPQS